VSFTATDPTESAALRTQVRVLLRLIVHMIVAQKATVDAHPGLKDNTLQARIYAAEFATQEMARDVLHLDDEDDGDDDGDNDDNDNDDDDYDDDAQNEDDIA
jgi:phosphopantothenoylcysteine synthetase/decarboxylase